MATLPVVLIGPILRRVEPRSVSVFVATGMRSVVQVLLYDGVVDASNPPAVHASAQKPTTAFGARFHATVVTVILPDQSALLAGHRYSYDMVITPDDQPPQSLQDLRLLSDDTMPGYGTEAPASAEVELCSIGYGVGQLPSFVTCPASLEELVIAHASCRKPHGAGSPALGYFDGIIEDLHGADAGRPHMLFLTGDQIYADDVAAALLPGLNALAVTLISGDGDAREQVVSPTEGGPFDVASAVLPAGFRQKSTGLAGFTSESAACHLIGFGEWLAMYCIAWNPHVWPTLAVADTSQATLSDELTAQCRSDAAAAPADAPRALGALGPSAAQQVLTPLYPQSDTTADAVQSMFAGFLAHKADLDAFRREVPKVRRVLANVPTYMIGDDHEVTDDWFMTGGIRAVCTNNPFGRAVLRNALSAYVVCQAWGDDPRAWDGDTDRSALLSDISGLFGPGWKGGPADPSACAGVDRALGLGPALEPSFDFSFTVDGPMHRVRVLDTRTRRLYDTPFAAPGLLTREALDRQLPAEDLPEGHVLFVVSPAPVFGPPVMSELGGTLAATGLDIQTFASDATMLSRQQSVTGLENGKPIGAQFFDVEHWGAHPAAFERLLARLAHYPRVVVLAGDVHYGGAYAMDWSGSAELGGNLAAGVPGSVLHSRIIHFTSSAARNAWAGPVRNLMLLNGLSVGLQRIGAPMTRLGWTATLPLVVDDMALEPPLARIHLQTGPVLLSPELFRKAHRLNRPPEWSWQATPILDSRRPAERPSAARSKGLEQELPAGSARVHSYQLLTAAHALALDTVAIARGLQFLGNVGVVRFGRAADGLHVSQSLYSLRARPEPNERADAYVVHDTLLEPVALEVPTSIGREH